MGNQLTKSQLCAIGEHLVVLLNLDVFGAGHIVTVRTALAYQQDCTGYP